MLSSFWRDHPDCAILKNCGSSDKIVRHNTTRLFPWQIEWNHGEIDSFFYMWINQTQRSNWISNWRISRVTFHFVGSVFSIPPDLARLWHYFPPPLIEPPQSNREDGINKIAPSKTTHSPSGENRWIPGPIRSPRTRISLAGEVGFVLAWRSLDSLITIIAADVNHLQKNPLGERARKEDRAGFFWNFTVLFSLLPDRFHARTLPVKEEQEAKRSPFRDCYHLYKEVHFFVRVGPWL